MHSTTDLDRYSASTPPFFSRQVQEATRFYLDLTPPETDSLVVVCGGRERCASDYAIHRPDFPYHSIELVARGRGSLTLAGREVILLPGTVFAYGPGVSQDITTDRDDPLVKYFVDFTGQRGRRLLNDYALPPGTSGRVVAPGEIEGVFDTLIQNGLKGTRFSGPLCAAMVEYLILKIAESLTTWEASQTPAYATYQRCRQFIQTHFLRLRALDQVARQCHVDPAYLCRLFRRYDHQTPHQFLMRLKMNLAAERLQSPGTLVKQVSAELGFDDAFHFSRAFKSVFGLSPEAFRRVR